MRLKILQGVIPFEHISRSSGVVHLGLGFEAALRGFRPEDHLRAPEQRQDAPAGRIGHHRIPDLRGAAQVLGARLADEGALADRSEMVAFQLDGREGSGALGQVGERGVGAGYV